jgi:C4-type Zn-finger protein
MGSPIEESGENIIILRKKGGYMITDEMEKKYLDRCSKCPYCDSDSIVKGNFRPEFGDEAVQNCFCNACGKRWMEVYKLVSIHAGNVRIRAEKPKFGKAKEKEEIKLERAKRHRSSFDC